MVSKERIDTYYFLNQTNPFWCSFSWTTAERPNSIDGTPLYYPRRQNVTVRIWVRVRSTREESKRITKRDIELLFNQANPKFTVRAYSGLRILYLTSDRSDTYCRRKWTRDEVIPAIKFGVTLNNWMIEAEEESSFFWLVLWLVRMFLRFAVLPFTVLLYPSAPWWPYHMTRVMGNGQWVISVDCSLYTYLGYLWLLYIGILNVFDKLPVAETRGNSPSKQDLKLV